VDSARKRLWIPVETGITFLETVVMVRLVRSNGQLPVANALLAKNPKQVGAHATARLRCSIIDDRKSQ
jgi:hypothetical protein